MKQTKEKIKAEKIYIRKCVRCGNVFKYNPIIVGDNVCPTCERMNDISFWYPRLFRLGFPMPKTIIIHTNVDMEKFSYGEEPEDINEFVMELWQAVKKIGLPVFLKTGYTSNKHDWKKSCFISKDSTLKDLKNHIFNLAEFSAMATIDRFMPCDFWAIREIIKTKSYFTYFNGEMPITKERRIFVRNGKIECTHSYWPEKIFEELEETKKKKFNQLDKTTTKDKKELLNMAQYVANIFQGYWSCDFLKGEDGKWYLTDMAIGEKSWHDENCKFAKLNKK